MGPSALQPLTATAQPDDMTTASETAGSVPTPTSPSRGRVVVGVDGSPQSKLALAKAVELARETGAVLEPIIAWRYPMATSPYVLASWSPAEDAAATMRDCLREVFTADVPEWVKPSVAPGPAAHALIEASKDAEIVVVGSRGHGGFAGLMLGSVSSACAEYAHCPVLVMREPETAKKK